MGDVVAMRHWEDWFGPDRLREHRWRFRLRDLAENPEDLWAWAELSDEERLWINAVYRQALEAPEFLTREFTPARVWWFVVSDYGIQCNHPEEWRSHKKSQDLGYWECEACGIYVKETRSRAYFRGGPWDGQWRFGKFQPTIDVPIPVSPRLTDRTDIRPEDVSIETVRYRAAHRSDGVTFYKLEGDS